jgi:hypothetical protein
MLDLDSIFGESKTRSLPSNIRPQVATKTEVLEPGPAPTVVTLRLLDPTCPAHHPFAQWVHRPDVHSRMGWERPDLSEADRWWARYDFEELPERVGADS